MYKIVLEKHVTNSKLNSEYLHFYFYIYKRVNEKKTNK